MRSTPLSMTVDVVHECAVIRAGLACMLGRLPGLCLSRATACAGDHACMRADEQASVAIVSPRAAHELAAEARKAGCDAPAPMQLIVIAPGFGDLEARAALQQGVMGLLLLTVEPDELLAAIRRVCLGHHYITGSIAERIAAQLYADALTSREQEILAFLSDGRCNKSIANELGIAVGTVKTHVKAILSKLNVGSRTEAVVVASRRGILVGVEALQRQCLPWISMELAEGVRHRHPGRSTEAR